MVHLVSAAEAGVVDRFDFLLQRCEWGKGRQASSAWIFALGSGHNHGLQCVDSFLGGAGQFHVVATKRITGGKEGCKVCRV